MPAREEAAVQLQVGAAKPRDGKGMARVSERALENMGLQPGAVIEIVGKRLKQESLRSTHRMGFLANRYS